MSVCGLIAAAEKKADYQGAIAHSEWSSWERKTPEKLRCWLISLLVFFGAAKLKLKEAEQGCSEPIMAALTVIGSKRDPAPCGLIWEFTGASCISLRHISLMSLSTAWIRRFTRPSCICRQLIESATGIQRTHLYFFSILGREASKHAALQYANVSYL